MATQSEMLLTWLNGTPTGGPNGDGRYPLMAKDGQIYLVPCPAAQALDPTMDPSELEIFANAASAAAGLANTSATNAATSESNAAASAADALASKNAAASSATAANTSRTQAATSASGASTSATNAASSASTASSASSAATSAKTAAETARNKAQDWADKAEDSPVETGKFSARHWALKAAASAASLATLAWDMVQNKPVTATRWPTYDEVTDKPALASESHTHEWVEVNDKPATATRWPSYDEVTDKPATATRWPAYDEVTDKPALAPENHTHEWAEVNDKPTTATRWPTYDEVTDKPALALESHTHTIANVTGLQAALDGKQAAGSYADEVHSHTWAEVSDKPETATRWPEVGEVAGLQGALNNKSEKSDTFSLGKGGPSSPSFNDDSDLNELKGNFSMYANSSVSNRPLIGNANILGFGLHGYNVQIAGRNDRLNFRTEEGSSWRGWREIVSEDETGTARIGRYLHIDQGRLYLEGSTDSHIMGTGSGGITIRPNGWSQTGQTYFRSSGEVTFSNDITIDGTRLSRNGENALRVTTTHGYFQAGPNNSTWCHMVTDRARFHFNTDIHVAGGIEFYGGPRVPKTFVQSGDPGSSASTGDLWIW